MVVSITSTAETFKHSLNSVVGAALASMVFTSVKFALLVAVWVWLLFFFFFFFAVATTNKILTCTSRMHAYCVLYCTDPSMWPGGVMVRALDLQFERLQFQSQQLSFQVITLGKLFADVCHCHTHTRLTALSPGPPRWAGTRKVKPIWILLEQETVSGSSISWAVCKSAPRSRQITTPTPHHSVFTGRMPFLPPNQQRQSTEGTKQYNLVLVKGHRTGHVSQDFSGLTTYGLTA